MTTGWIITLTVLATFQFLFNFFVLLSIIGLIRKIDINYTALKMVATITDNNFTKAAKFIDEIAKIMIVMIGTQAPTAPTMTKVSPPDGNFKN